MRALSFFCDCSSYVGDNKFAVVGGVAVKRSKENELSEEISKIKSLYGIKGEFKWNSYRAGPRKIAYESLINTFFEALKADDLHFHCMIVDFDEFDHHLNGRGSPSKSVNKLYFQLMLHTVCKLYGRNWRISMFPDHGNDSELISGFREQICAAAYKRYSALPNCLRAVHPTASKKNELLQMVDVVIGIIAAEREDRLLGHRKAALREFFMEKCQIKDFSKNTASSVRDFTVWNFEM